MPTSRAFLATLVVSAAASGAPAQVLLYDVDFSSPLHTVGQPPTTGIGSAPRATTTNNFPPHPRVAASVGPLTDQPLELSTFPDSTAAGSSFALRGVLGFGELYDAYHMSFDLVITEPGRPFGGGFTLFADVPTIRPIWWRWDGNIQVGTAGFVGSWQTGELQHVEVLWNLATHSYTMSINDTEIFTLPFDAVEIRSIRTTIGNNTSQEGPVTIAGVDNIRIHGIPAPGAALVMLAPLLFRRRRADALLS